MPSAALCRRPGGEPRSTGHRSTAGQRHPWQRGLLPCDRLAVAKRTHYLVPVRSVTMPALA
jgi:hypothetical protein